MLVCHTKTYVVLKQRRNPRIANQFQSSFSKLHTASLFYLAVAVLFAVFQRYFVRDPGQGADKE